MGSIKWTHRSFRKKSVLLSNRFHSVASKLTSIDESDDLATELGPSGVVTFLKYILIRLKTLNINMLCWMNWTILSMGWSCAVFREFPLAVPLRKDRKSCRLFCFFSLVFTSVMRALAAAPPTSPALRGSSSPPVWLLLGRTTTTTRHDRLLPWFCWNPLNGGSWPPVFPQQLAVGFHDVWNEDSLTAPHIFGLNLKTRQRWVYSSVFFSWRWFNCIYFGWVVVTNTI